MLTALKRPLGSRRRELWLLLGREEASILVLGDRTLQIGRTALFLWSTFG